MAKTASTSMGRKRPVVKFEEITECPKCGGADLYRQYHANTHAPGCDLFEFEPECCAFEHHCRGCRGCHFEWVEEVKLSISDQPQEEGA